jgi:hypothetical protein
MSSYSINFHRCQVLRKVDSFHINHLSALICVTICAYLRELLQRFNQFHSSGEFPRRLAQIYPQIFADTIY